jgi:outer membrane biosynthesis protein TonB
MSRRPRPLHRAGYPTLAGLLALGPGLALADVSPPPPPDPGRPPRPPVATPGEHPPPQAQPGKPPREPPKLMGKIACPRKPGEMPAPAPPKPPPAAKKAAPAEKPKVDFMIEGGLARARPPAPLYRLASSGIGLVVHPHGPDEPCTPIDAHEEEA